MIVFLLQLLTTEQIAKIMHDILYTVVQYFYTYTVAHPNALKLGEDPAFFLRRGAALRNGATEW